MNNHHDNFELIDSKNLFIKKARRIANFCAANNFEGIECLHGLKVKKLVSYYDGIGPNWKWPVIKEIIGHIDFIFEAAAFLYDVQFHVCFDRSNNSFHQINRQFYENCLKCISILIPWYHFIRRLRAYRSARVLFSACEEHGWESWKNCGKKEASQ